MKKLSIVFAIVASLVVLPATAQSTQYKTITLSSGEKLVLLEKIQTKYPKLVDLIVTTESMEHDEKQYWFDILPSMTDAQRKKLFNILSTERKKLNELEKKYQKEAEKLKQ